jgi:hypothetical protein
MSVRILPSWLDRYGDQHLPLSLWQRDAECQGVNIVNAAGGMVANGIGVARTAGMNSAPTITQSNSVSQVR